MFDELKKILISKIICTLSLNITKLHLRADPRCLDIMEVHSMVHNVPYKIKWVLYTSLFGLCLLSVAQSKQTFWIQNYHCTKVWIWARYLKLKCNVMLFTVYNFLKLFFLNHRYILRFKLHDYFFHDNLCHIRSNQHEAFKSFLHFRYSNYFYQWAISLFQISNAFDKKLFYFSLFQKNVSLISISSLQNWPSAFQKFFSKWYQ